MLDQLLTGVLLFLGVQLGSVRGESTPSAVASASAVKSIGNAIQNALRRPEKITAFSLRDMRMLEASIANNRKLGDDLWKEKEAVWKKEFTKVTDEGKKKNLETIQNTFKVINDKETNNMLANLTAVNQLIAKMREELKTNGGNHAVLNKSIDDAETAVASAMTAVTAQMQKTYVIGVSDGDKKLRDDVAKVRKQLETDLKNVRTQAKSAREKTGKAYQEYQKVIKKAIRITEPALPLTPTVTPMATPKPTGE